MNARTFERIVAVAKAACYRPTHADQKAACGPIADLTPEEKIAAVRRFVDRHLRLWEEGASDWTASVFVHGVIGGRERLPWTRADLEHVLDGVIRCSGVLPPELVARAVEQFLRDHGPADPALKKKIAAAATSMWPPDATEGAGYRKAAARLRALVKAR